MKKCPFCAEEIQDEAIKCRFCAEFLKKKKKWKTCLVGCLIAFFVSILLLLLFIYFTFVVLKFVAYKIFFIGPDLPHYHLPFTGQGIAGILKEFAEAFRALWERMRSNPSIPFFNNHI